MLKTLPLKYQLGIGFGAVLAVFAAVILTIGYERDTMIRILIADDHAIVRAITLGAKSLSFL